MEATTNEHANEFMDALLKIHGGKRAWYGEIRSDRVHYGIRISARRAFFIIDTNGSCAGLKFFQVVQGIENGKTEMVLRETDYCYCKHGEFMKLFKHNEQGYIILVPHGAGVVSPYFFNDYDYDMMTRPNIKVAGCKRKQDGDDCFSGSLLKKTKENHSKKSSKYEDEDEDEDEHHLCRICLYPTCICKD